MGIFVIGYKETPDNGRLVRLYNNKKKEIKDLKESDLFFLSDHIQIENAVFDGKKLKGSTGSLNKILNENFYVVLGSIIQDEAIVGYRLVNTGGKEIDVKLEDIPKIFATSKVQNASLVDGKYIRGIKWNIPVILEKPTEKKAVKSMMGALSNNYQKKSLLFDELAQLNKISKGQILMVFNHFKDNSTIYIKNNKLKVSMNSFYLRTTCEDFYSILIKLSKYSRHFSNINQSVEVDEKNFIIKVPSLTDNLEEDIKEVKGICSDLGYTLNLQVLLNLNPNDIHYDSIIDLEKLYLSFDVNSRDFVSDKNWVVNSAYWRGQIYSVYYKYMSYLGKKIGVSLNVFDNFIKINDSTVNIEIKTTGSTLSFQRADKSKKEKVSILSLSDDPCSFDLTIEDYDFSTSELIVNPISPYFYLTLNEDIFYKFYETCRLDSDFYDKYMHNETVIFMSDGYYVFFATMCDDFLNLITVFMKNNNIDFVLDLSTISKLDYEILDVIETNVPAYEDDELRAQMPIEFVELLDNNRPKYKKFVDFFIKAYNTALNSLVSYYAKKYKIKVIGSTNPENGIKNSCRVYNEVGYDFAAIAIKKLNI